MSVDPGDGPPPAPAPAPALAPAKPETDAFFVKQRETGLRRRRRGRWRSAAVTGLIGAAGAAGYWHLSGAGQAPDPTPAVAEFRPVNTSLPGDPMILRIAGAGESGQYHQFPPPDALAHLGPLVRIRDRLISTDQRLNATLPSTQADFAHFQALSDGAAPGATPGATPISAPDVSSVAVLRPEADRQKLFADTITKIRDATSLAALLGGPQDDIGADVPVAPGDIVALRRRPAPGQSPGQATGPAEPIVAALYRDGAFSAAFAVTDAGLQDAADPWVDAEFAGQQGVATDRAPKSTGTGMHRMMDAYYATALRNGAPAETVGAAIALLTRRHDLARFTSGDARMTLIYGAGGRVIYTAISAADHSIECFVLPDVQSGDPACQDSSGSTRAFGLRARMVLPVSGILTSPFGPRKHPIHGDIRPHTGVDWAAAEGTPVRAALGGRVRSAGDGGGYGNLLILDHGEGRETRYAHLHGFAKGIEAGARIEKGDVIGFVGTTGASTGPHLHFEFRQNAAPIDPFSGPGGGGAVDILVERIIDVESAGNARAKNPNSSATGLGQFIASTWLEMITRYKPELAQSLDQTALLDLRNDPTLSREMVRHLAQENAAFLRSRTHKITPGRLYLAHFLGTEDADRVLRAPANRAIEDIVAAPVIAANGFLAGMDAAQVGAWAENKMQKRLRRAQGRVAVHPHLAALRAALAPYL